MKKPTKQADDKMTPIIKILEHVSHRTGIPVAAICSGRRTNATTHSRFAVAWLIRQHLPWWSLAEIAAAIGRTDHGTAAHSIWRAVCLNETDDKFHEILTTYQP